MRPTGRIPNQETRHVQCVRSASGRRVVAIEELPIGANASRRAVVRWSDGSRGEALRWFDDEVLFSEGDLRGTT
jgi:hypothetical protein